MAVVQDLENFLPCLYRDHQPFDVKGEQCVVFLINCVQVIPDGDVVPAWVVVGSLDPSFASVFSESFDDFCILFVHGPSIPHLLQEQVTQYSVFIFVDGLGDTYVGFHCDLLTKVISDPGSMFIAFWAP